MNYWKHFKLITTHKWYVMRECFKVGLYWQGIVHDLSKYHPDEFITSAQYFHGEKTPINIERANRGYSLVWLHHEHRNKHHWQYWLDIKGLDIITIPIPDKYILEMACDIVSASRTYGKEKYTREEPIKYVREHCHWRMDPKSEQKLILLLEFYALVEKIDPTILKEIDCD